MNPGFLLKFQQNLPFYGQGFFYKYVFFIAQKSITPSHDSDLWTLIPFYRKNLDFFAPKILKLKSHQSVLRAIQPHKEPMHKNNPSIEQLDFAHQIKEASPCEDWLQNIVL